MVIKIEENAVGNELDSLWPVLNWRVRRPCVNLNGQISSICCNIYHIHTIMQADLNLVYQVTNLPRTCAISHGALWHMSLGE